jgi:glucose repression regulatory protein TUP1
VAFSHDGRHLATGAEDKLARVWNIELKQLERSFSGHDQDVYAVAWFSGMTHIASCSGDHTVRLWDRGAGNQVWSQPTEDGLTCIAISPNDNYVVAGSLDHSITVWNNHGVLVGKSQGDDVHKDSVYSVNFSPNGETLVSGSLDKTVKLWYFSKVSAGESKDLWCLRTFKGHSDFVLCTVFTADGSLIMSGSKDETVRFWNPTSSMEILRLVGHKSSVISVVPSSKGEFFATCGGDLSVRVWKYHRTS